MDVFHFITGIFSLLVGGGLHRIFTIRAEKRKLANQISVEEYKSLTSVVDDFSNRVTRYAGQIDDLHNKITKAKAEIADLLQEIADLREENASLKQKIKTFQGNAKNKNSSSN